MAGSVCKVILVGNVGKDPEIRSTQGGDQVASLSLATSESWTDKRSGERQERTEWHRVVIWNTKITEVCEKYVEKGTKLYLEGTLQTRKWTDREGNERWTTEVVVPRFGGALQILSARRGGEEGPHDRAAASSDGTYGGTAGGASGGSSGASRGPSWDTPRPAGGGRLDDDEIPFGKSWQ